VILELPRNHGIHIHEAIGMVLITLGVLALLRAQK
jgi:hypothetical protein